MGVAIVTDSGCDLTAEEAKRARIDIVPIYIVFGNDRLRDGVDLTRERFFARMKDTMPKTEPPAVGDFRAAFKSRIDGGNEVVCVTISAGLSQTFKNAADAAVDFGGKVHVVDSRGASGMEVLLALYAADLAAAGMAAATIAERISPANLKHGVYFAVPDVTQLGRSGRLPKPLVALGSMMNVSLVMKMNESGGVGLAGQSRSFEKTCDIMVDSLARAVDRSPNARIAISHVMAPETAAALSKSIESKFDRPPSVHEATLTLATHLGVGAVGIFAIVP